jgi:flagellar P-ring protein precursor FlgI
MFSRPEPRAMIRLLRPLLGAILILLLGLLSAAPVRAASRIKDIVDFEGVRENQLVGYGLVVGLNGSGDSLRNAPFTRQSLEAMLERLGVNTRDAQANTRNVAAVMVTAHLPAFAMNGARIDVTVSALGDSKSLGGGVLLATPLMGADGEIYAVAQGAVAASGFAAGGDGASITQGVPTVARIANGGLVERESTFELANRDMVRLSLRNPDFATSARVAGAINSFLGAPVAHATSNAVVELSRPAAYAGDMVALITEIERLMVDPDLPAKVVVDEATGVVVIGDRVRVSTVAIAQGSLTISVRETPMASQPAPFSEGSTEVLPRTDLAVEEGAGSLAYFSEGGVALRDLVDGLNALGVSPRDLISILQALKAAGAIQAEIEVL